MRSPLLCAGLLALCSSLAHATPTTWSFTYTGFYSEEQRTFLPDWSLSGTFSGVDANRDGLLVASELTSLAVGHLDYIQCRSDEFMTCGTRSFEFRLPGVTAAAIGMAAAGPQLAFDLGFEATDPEWFVGAGRRIQTGLWDYNFRFEPSSFSEQTYSWSDETRLSINAVPEPSSWALLGAGLLAVGTALGRKPAGRRRG